MSEITERSGEKTVSPVRVFSDRSHYKPQNRDELAELLKPFWKEHEFSDAQRREMYGLSKDDFQMVSSPSEADVVVLPLSWNYYLRHGRTALALRLIEEGRRCKKPVIVYVTGDHGVGVPFRDVFVVRASGYRSRKAPQQFAQPVFIEDPLKITKLGGWQPRGKGPKPVVGFCGQAYAGHVKVLLDTLRTLTQNTQYHLRLGHREPDTIYPSVMLRSRALDVLEKSPLVVTNFIRRGHYRAGAKTPKRLQETKREFYENIAQSDYTLCVRGGGNFSARLYETMAMGRIPIFVNTDCLLPFENQIDWRHFCVWIEANELDSLPLQLIEHYSQFDETQFAALQKECRTLWEEWLTFSGFARHLAATVILASARQLVAGDPHRSTLSSLS